MSARPPARLTLGPLLFHWPARKRRDFYLRIADEAPVDTVYLGEVVCSKRDSEFAGVRDEVIERLRAAGKEVVLSTLALVTTPAEVEAIRAVAGGELLVEANDVAVTTQTPPHRVCPEGQGTSVGGGSTGGSTGGATGGATGAGRTAPATTPTTPAAPATTPSTKGGGKG